MLQSITRIVCAALYIYLQWLHNNQKLIQPLTLKQDAIYYLSRNGWTTGDGGGLPGDTNTTVGIQPQVRAISPHSRIPVVECAWDEESEVSAKKLWGFEEGKV